MKHKGPIIIIIIAAAVALIFITNKSSEIKQYDTIAEVGQAAPDFEYPDSKGNLWKLADLRGKVVFMNFWATWCTTCEAEMESKHALHMKMEGKPFQMLGMLFRDDPDNLPEYFETHTVSAPTLISPGNESAKKYGITGVPETFIIDKEGIIREKIVGPRVWDAEEQLALIEKWL